MLGGVAFIPVTAGGICVCGRPIWPCVGVAAGLIKLPSADLWVMLKVPSSVLETSGTASVTVPPCGSKRLSSSTISCMTISV